jgi:hypothetical protein
VGDLGYTDMLMMMLMMRIGGCGQAPIYCVLILLLPDAILFKLCSKLYHLEDKDTIIHCLKGERGKEIKVQKT